MSDLVGVLIIVYAFVAAYVLIKLHLSILSPDPEKDEKEPYQEMVYKDGQILRYRRKKARWPHRSWRKWNRRQKEFEAYLKARREFEREQRFKRKQGL